MHLSLFDKINIAHCAMQRAQNKCGDVARFNGEYDTVVCWHNHRVAFIPSPKGPLSHTY